MDFPHIFRASVLLVLASCQAPEAPRSNLPAGTVSTATTKPDWSGFTLGPSDLVHVKVFGQESMSSPAAGVRVAPDGTLSLPLVGGVSVTGLSANQAAKTIEERLQRYIKGPSVSVSILEYSSRRFYLFGEIANTGSYPMDRPLTALEALAMGGGIPPGANRTRSFLIRRRGEAGLEVIAFNALTPGPDGLVQVRAGDMLFVQKSGVGTFSETVQPYLSGMGMTMSQIASLALAYDRLYND